MVTGRWGYAGSRTKETGNQFPPMRISPFGSPRGDCGGLSLAWALLMLAGILLILNIATMTI
jgi:hypothetical protein